MKYRFLLFLVFFSLKSFSQSQWGSIILPQDTFSYWLGPAEPDPQWRSVNFNDNQWPKGIAGFGYGDGDDATVLPNATSVQIRNTFYLQDLNGIEVGIFHLDFDDGFVAYLNGVEIARENMVDSFPNASDFATGLREATMYQGGNPQAFFLNSGTLKSLLKVGKNVLAIQVHNNNANSSDLSCIPFLSVQLTTQANPFHPIPSWFIPPFELTKSHLPIISINTFGQKIVDDPEIQGEMRVLFNTIGDTNYLNATNEHYNGKINIELRGESTLFAPKKSYKLETKDSQGNNLNFPLLGLNPENDWILYAPYSDKSLMRNVFSFQLGKKLFEYSSPTRYCELVVNGEYVGLYVLMEKIKRDKNRVNLATLTPQDTVGEELTGGYIFRMDKIEPNGSPGFYSYPIPKYGSYAPNYFQYYDPKDEELLPQQKQYLIDYVQAAESSLSSSNFLTEPSGYQNYFDLESFVGYHILNELTKNVDGYRFSTFFYKDKNEKIKAGPPWDYNLAYGNVDYWDEAYDIDGWIYPYWDRLWWTDRMLQDSSYVSALHCKWQSLRLNAYSNQNIEEKLDSIANYLGPAIDRNFEKWNILGQYVWPNNFIGNTHNEEVSFLKNWIIDRAEWLDGEWNMNCPSLGIDAPNESFMLSIYPNPAKDELVISLSEEGTYFVSISTLFGQPVMKKSVNFPKRSKIIDVSGLSPGFYLISIYNKEKVYAQKLIIEQ